MSFGIEELIAAPRQRYDSEHQVSSIHYLIDLANKLAFAANLSEPQFNVSRKPGMVSHRKCLDCGAILSSDELDVCNRCRPDDRLLRAAREMRADIKAAEKILAKTERRLRRDAKGQRRGRAQSVA